jgi:hypothetical protein
MSGANHGTKYANAKAPMITANCRARFTAEDFDFVVKTLGKSPRDSVSLADLLTDTDTRDAILDHRKLFDAILSSVSSLSISPQLYFYILTRHVLKKTGIDDRKLSDYIASLLECFSRTARMRSPVDEEGQPIQYLSDMLLALKNASPSQSFLIRAHVGNYSLFITGIFHENVLRRMERGAPDFSFYEGLGRSNYRLVADHSVARSWGLTDTFDALAERFREIRLALNDLSDRLLHIDRGPLDSPLIA